MTCTACGAVCETGTKYCVICGALLPLDEDSANYFATLFLDQHWGSEVQPREIDEADVDTATRPRTVSAMRAMDGPASSARSTTPRRQKFAHRADTDPGATMPGKTPTGAEQRRVSDTSVIRPPAVPFETTGSGRTVETRPPGLPPASRAAASARPPSMGAKRSRALVIGAVTLLMMTILGVGSLVMALQGTDATPVSSSAVVTTQTSASPTAVGLPSGAIACTETVARNQSTSCEFAANVAVQVRQAGDVDSFQVSAYSPVTKKSYTMTCQKDTWTTCTGGVNAVVYVLA